VSRTTAKEADCVSGLFAKPTGSQRECGLGGVNRHAFSLVGAEGKKSVALLIGKAKLWVLPKTIGLKTCGPGEGGKGLSAFGGGGGVRVI